MSFSRHGIQHNWKDTISAVHVRVFPGSAERSVRRGGITNHHLIAYSLSNISAKNYQNRLMCVEVIMCNISVFEALCIIIKLSLLSDLPEIGIKFHWPIAQKYHTKSVLFVIVMHSGCQNFLKSSGVLWYLFKKTVGTYLKKLGTFAPCSSGDDADIGFGDVANDAAIQCCRQQHRLRVKQCSYSCHVANTHGTHRTRFLSYNIHAPHFRRPYRKSVFDKQVYCVSIMLFTRKQESFVTSGSED